MTAAETQVCAEYLALTIMRRTWWTTGADAERIAQLTGLPAATCSELARSSDFQGEIDRRRHTLYRITRRTPL